jgi:NADH-quinone oxidoreductase subunit C
MVADLIKEKFPDAVVEVKEALGELTIFVEPSRIVDVCRFLKNEQEYNRLSGVTAVDWHPANPRFEVVYHLHSQPRNQRLRLKCRLAGDAAEIDSITPVWRGADWYEREVFDMFGISFRNHPNLTRILMPLDWEGYPLRKDYPVHGHRYSYPKE